MSRQTSRARRAATLSRRVGGWLLLGAGTTCAIALTGPLLDGDIPSEQVHGGLADCTRDGEYWYAWVIRPTYSLAASAGPCPPMLGSMPVFAFDPPAEVFMPIRELQQECSGTSRVRRIQSGWPWPAFHGAVIESPSNRAEPYGEYTLERALGAAIATTEPRNAYGFQPGAFMPLLPLWGGLLADSALLASVAAALCWTPALLKQYRSKRRRARGLCARCAHCLGPHLPTRCQECGHPVLATGSDAAHL